MPYPRRNRPATWLLSGGIPMLLGLSACAGSATRAPEQTPVMEELGPADISSRRVRIAADNAAERYLGTIELSADSIIKTTDRPDVALNALSWKANAIPVVQRVMHHPDALVSFVDGWVFIEQMHDYFDQGRGRELFGTEQRIAVDATRGLATHMDSLIALELDTADYRRYRGFVDRWVDRRPLDNDLFVRASAVQAAAEELADHRMGGLSAIGELEELAVDAQQMAQSYLAYTPKVVLWQAELMVMSMMDTTRLSPLLSSVERMAVMQAATGLMEGLPELVANERRATLGEMRLLTDTATAHLVTLVASERQTILLELARLVREERGALLADVEETVLLAMEQGRLEATALVDHTLWRLAQGAAVLMVLLALAFFLVLRRLERARSA